MTPGPWIVSGVRGKSLPPNTEFHYVGPDGDFLAAVFYKSNTGLGWEDAHLIAAAPQLLAALQRLMGGTTSMEDALAAARQARLAIAYATNQPLKELS